MKVIFVCTGNTCRSPLAEGYLKSFNIKGLTVQSRGLLADGSMVSENSLIAAKEFGFDIEGHISRQFSLGDTDADRIICLSKNHCTALINWGINPSKISVLGNGIADPYSLSLEHYRFCLNQIADEIDSLVYNGFFTEIKVKNADDNDIMAIVRLEQLCFSTPWNERAIAESIEAGTHFFTAQISNETVGYIGISAIAGEGYITNIAVDPNFRRLGVATLLINRVFTLARKQGLSFVSLEVRKSNIGAISLYSKHLFNTEGLRKNFYSAPTEDAIIMTRRFNH